MPMFFDYDGNAVDEKTWGTLIHSDQKVLARNVLDDKKMIISTVWIGLSWEDEQPPLIYETMAFPEDSYEDMGCWRWATRAEALEGHKRLVKEIKDKK
jgi:hypothetical protein